MLYTCSLLLRTLPAIDLELNPPDQEPQIIFDLPRPKRDDVVSPERAMVNRMAARYAPITTPVAPDDYDGYTSISDPLK
jgi:hypothetical protein